MTTAGVVVGEFPVPTASSAPRGIAAGPDGNLWFTEYDGQPDRTDHHGRSHHGVPDSHGRQQPVSNHRSARTAISGSPKEPPTRSVGSRRPASSPSSRSPRPTAARYGSQRVRTATSGSPSPMPTRSGESPRPVSSPSSRFRPPTACLSVSRPARMATSGLPKRMPTRLAGSRRLRRRRSAWRSILIPFKGETPTPTACSSRGRRSGSTLPGRTP